MAQKVMIGQMVQVVTFRNNTERTALGAGHIDGYTDLLTTRGQLMKRTGNKGRKESEDGEVFFQEYWILTCRYQPALEANLKIDTLIVCDGKTYTITGYELLDQKKFFYQFALAAKD